MMHRRQLWRRAPLQLLAFGVAWLGASNSALAQINDEQPWDFMLEDDQSELSPALWVEAGAFATDNAERAVLGSEDNVLFSRIGGTLVRETGRLSAALRGDVEYRHYLQDTFADQTIVNMDVASKATLVDRRVFWVLDDTFGQVLTDPLQPDVSSNRGDANVFRTGPDFVFRFGDQTLLEASARYENSYFETTDIDGSSVSGNLGLYRVLGSSDTLGARLEFSDFSPKSPARPDYSVARALGRWERRTGVNLAVAEAGVGRIRAVGATTSGPVGTLMLNKSLRPSLVLEASVSRDYSDSADLFFDLSREGSNEVAVDLQSRQLPAVVTSSTVSLRGEYRRTVLRLRLSRLDENVQNDFATANTPGDRTTSAIGFTVERRLSSKTTLALDAEYANRDYQPGVGDDRDTIASITAIRQFGRHITGQFGYQYWHKNSDIEQRQYSENRFRLTIRYAWR